MESPRILVVATTTEGTSRAVETACGDARATRANVVLLVPATSTAAERAGDYRAIAALRGTTLAVCRCMGASAREILDVMHIAGARIFLGGYRGRWWPTREQRLARRLARRGHHVTFTEVTPSDTP